MKIKKKEFLSLKQERMSVAEYKDKCIELSRYATEEVVVDKKKHELFLDGLAGPWQYKLMSHAFPTFQQLVDTAIHLEHKRKELGEQKRKATSSRQSESTCFSPALHPTAEHVVLLRKTWWKLWATAVPASRSAFPAVCCAV
jgi:hypothetical protein